MHLQLSSIEEVRDAIKSSFSEAKEDVLTFNLSHLLGSEHIEPDYNWIAGELGLSARVFQGHRMENTLSFAREIYAVLQLTPQENCSFDAMYDDMYEFDHWVEGESYIFIINNARAVMRDNPSKRDIALKLFYDYVELVNSKDHYPDRRLMLILVE